MKSGNKRESTVAESDVEVDPVDEVPLLTNDCRYPPHPKCRRVALAAAAAAAAAVGAVAAAAAAASRRPSNRNTRTAAPF